MDFRRLFDLFPYQQARFPKKVALACRKNLSWEAFSTEECIAEIDRVSAGLLDLGLQRGDKLAIMTALGSPYWNFLDLGMQQIGVIPVPIHATVTREELEFILKDAGVKYCIVGNRELHDAVKAVESNVLSLKGIYTLEPLPDIPGWEDLLSQPMEKHLEALQGLKAAIHEDDLATIIYTSGSTGQPKGVMLSHKNIVSNIKAVISLIPVNCDKRVLSLLPLSHIFERMVTFTYIAVGASLYYTAGRDTVYQDLSEVRPHYFTAVPRMLEKMQDNILEEAANTGSLRRRLIEWAIHLGKRYKEDRKISLSFWMRQWLADLLVYRKWRRQLGGKIEGIIVGAAALRPELGRLFSAAGIDVREGYGLTETSPVVAFNRFEPGGVRFGTVGIPIPGVEVRIDAPDSGESGEILVKGPNVMLGYYHEEPDHSPAFTPDGWFRTGDIGKLVQKRFLKITGRKKDIFKTSTGKYIAPERLENTIKESPFIEQCLMVGENRPYPAALIVPHFPLLKKWCSENDVHWTAPQFMVLNPKVQQLFEQEINRFNDQLAPHQQVRKFSLLHEPWTPENGALTPTLKLRRQSLRHRYARTINQMYEKNTH
jgi:long-chain acyl-CoA synthetase